MDRFKFTTIAHRHHAICNPISSESLDAVLAELTLGPEDTAIDIGCGKGEALIRLGERYWARGVGLDVNPTHAYGSFRSALESLSRLVRPGGSILIGEGYWRREPDPGYLHLLGAEPDELNDRGQAASRLR